MLTDFAAITHVGRVRKNNEDAYLVSALDGEEPAVNCLRPITGPCRAGVLVAVADGMGGAASGEIASREGLASMALNLFGHWGRFHSAKIGEADLLQAMGRAVEEASSAVLRYADMEEASRGMGSTLTGALIWNGHAHLAQVGDSRAYLFRGGQLVQLTEDQTLMREMIVAGTLTEEEARTHPHRNLITQALGCSTPLKVVLSSVALCRGDRLMLCSDGLHGEVPDPRLEEIFRQGLGLQETLEQLLQEALNRGGRDNITILMVGLDTSGPLPPVPGEMAQVEAPSHEGFFSRLGRMLRGN